MTDIFNKFTFANRKLVLIVKSHNVRDILQTWSLNTKNNFIANNIVFIFT